MVSVFFSTLQIAQAVCVCPSSCSKLPAKLLPSPAVKGKLCPIVILCVNMNICMDSGRSKTWHNSDYLSFWRSKDDIFKHTNASCISCLRCLFLRQGFRIIFKFGTFAITRCRPLYNGTFLLLDFYPPFFLEKWPLLWKETTFTLGPLWKHCISIFLYFAGFTLPVTENVPNLMPFRNPPVTQMKMCLTSFDLWIFWA